MRGKLGLSTLRFLLWVGFVLSQGRSLKAQTPTAAITGVVTDSSGGLVRDAKVKATNTEMDRAWSAASDSSGEFQFQNLPPGFYALEVSAPGFQVFRASAVRVAEGRTCDVAVELTVESARKVVIVNAGPADDYKPTTATVGNLSNLPLEQLPLTALVVTRSVLDDQQSRLLSEVAKNDASVGEDYVPVGWYEDFMIRGFTLDLASGFKINGLSSAGEQIVALENKDSVEFLHGVDADEVGVASGGGTTALFMLAVSNPSCRHAFAREFAGLLDRCGSRLYALLLTLNYPSQHAELESRHEPGNDYPAKQSHCLLLLR